MKSLAWTLRNAGLVAAFSLLTAPAAFAAQTEDVWITTKVKMALLTDDTVDGLDIDVDTFDSRVTLHGQVDSSVEKAEAESLARKIEGVSDVRNLLAVVPATSRKATEVKDDALAEQVRTVLERDKALASSDIEVKSVNKGVVLLSGQAKTLSAHYRAIEDARAVPGVRQVASEIKSPDELADAEIWEGSEPEAATEEVKASASDAWITTKVKVLLMAEPGLSPIGVNVDTRAGVVTLFGTVPTEALKARATTQARDVSGVKGVENELQVVPDAVAKRVEAKDEQVLEAVRKRLDTREALADSDIDVAVENGVVRLTGTVATQRDRLTALTVARSTDGVGSVIDALELKRPQG
jgi:hyperosmotically inducible periplasmic protein